MPLGSVLNIIGQGAKLAARGARAGAGKFGQLFDAEEAIAPRSPAPAAMTPGFNPDTPIPLSNTAVPSTIVEPPAPILPRGNLENLLPKYDSITGATTKAPPPPRLSLDAEAAMAPPGNVPAGPIAPAPRREEVGIPQLPGRTGAPRPYDPMTAAKYDDVMASGRTSDKVKGLGDRARSGLTPAVLGFLQAAAQNKENPLAAGLGGAAAGFAGGAIDPTAGREYEFDVLRRPQLEEQEKRRQAEEALGIQREKARVDIEGTRAETDLRRAQADSARAGMKDAGLERIKRQAEIDRLNAQTEAIRTGRPTQKDILDEDGQVRTYNIYPDGRKEVVGGSAAADMASKKIKSQEEIAAENRKAKLQGVAMQQAGANSRSAGKKAIKTVTKDDITEAMKDPANKGLSRDQVKEIFKKSGYIVPKY